MSRTTKITRAVTFAAAGTQQNLLQPTLLQYAPYGGFLRVGATLSASTGGLTGQNGANTFIENAYIPPNNRVPLLPEDYMTIDEQYVLPGEQLLISATVNGAATLIFTVELIEA